MIKKLLVPLAVFAALALAACGGSSDNEKASPSLNVTASPAATAAVSASPTSLETVAPESTEANAETGADESTGDVSESGEEESAENAEASERGISNNETSPEEISIINGTSIEIYGIYITSTTDGNPGENIITGSTLGEGEEITLAYANIENSDSLSIIIEDESGIQYRASGFELTNGSIVELRLNGSSLEAIVQ